MKSKYSLMKWIPFATYMTTKWRTWKGVCQCMYNLHKAAEPLVPCI